MTDLSLIEDSFAYAYPASLDDLSLNNAIDWLSFKDENQQSYAAYYDFSVWPPQPLPTPNTQQDKEFFLDWLPFDQSEKQQIWKRITGKNPKRPHYAFFQFARIISINPWQTEIIGDKNHQFSQFFGRTSVTPTAIFHVNEIIDDKGRAKQALIKLSENSTENNAEYRIEAWYESQIQIFVYPFPDSKNCLVVRNNQKYCITDKAVQDSDFIAFSKPPYAHNENFLTISTDEFVYFTAIKRPHAGHGNWPEWILQFNKINIHTSAHYTAEMDGFGNLQAQTVLVRETNAKKKIKRSNFVGVLRAHKGHDNWWILNYGSNEAGVPDIACFYNDKTNETFKISRGDFGKREPNKIVYIQKLGRYLAIDSDFVFLMPPFESIYAAKKITSIYWLEKTLN
jgi:hypothetical protein